MTIGQSLLQRESRCVWENLTLPRSTQIAPVMWGSTERTEADAMTLPSRVDDEIMRCGSLGLDAKHT